MGALASYVGNPAAFNSLHGPSYARFIGQLGVRKHFSSGTQDCSNKFAGSQAVFGTRTLHPVPDIERSDFILLIGENPAVSHMSFLSIAHPMKALPAAQSGGLFGVGLLGAAMAHVPLINLFAPALSGLAFVHYLLSALRVARQRDNIIEVN